MSKKTKRRLRELEQQVGDLQIEMMAFDRSASVAIAKAREDAIAYVVQLAKEGSLCDNPTWKRSRQLPATSLYCPGCAPSDVLVPHICGLGNGSVPYTPPTRTVDGTGTFPFATPSNTTSANTIDARTLEQSLRSQIEGLHDDD